MDFKKIIFAFLILFFCTIEFFHKLVFTDLTYFQRDIMLQFKPWKVFINSMVHKVFKEKDFIDFLPLWNPYNHCGAPLMANLQSQVFYPFSIFFYIIPDFVTAYKFFLITHFTLSALFMFIFLNSKKVSFLASLTGSIIWAFNGFMIGRVEFLSVLGTIIWLPFIVFFVDRLVELQNIKNVIFLGFVVSIQFLAGHAQMWFYTLCFIFLYTLFFTFVKKNYKILIAFFFSILLSLFFSGIQLLPTVEFFLNSTRSGGMSFSEASFLSLRLKDLLSILYPFYWRFDPKVLLVNRDFYLPHYWTYTFYLGFIGTIIGILGFIHYKPLKEKIFYMFILLLSLFYSLGENSFFFPLLYEHFYIFRIFRHPSCGIYILIFLLSLMSAYGVEFISKISHFFKYKTPILVLIIVSVFVELHIYSKKISVLLPKSIFYEIGPNTDFVKNLADIKHYRIALTPLTQKEGHEVFGETFYEAKKKYFDRLFSNINLNYRLYNFRGQDIELTNFYRFMDCTYSQPSLDDALPFFSIANVKYIISIKKHSTKYAKLIKDNEIKIYENPYALPRIYFVREVIFEPDINKSLEIIKEQKFKFLTKAIIHSPSINFHITGSKVDNYRITEVTFLENKIKFKIETPTSGFAIISQNFYPGWKCKINNKPAPLYKANIFMTAIPLPSGEYIVELKYEPLSFWLGCIITLSFIFIALIYFLIKGIRQLRKYENTKSRDFTDFPQD